MMEEKSYVEGFVAGLKEAANTLRMAANDHSVEAHNSKKVLEAQANELAEAILRSWANGLDIQADNFRG